MEVIISFRILAFTLLSFGFVLGYGYHVNKTEKQKSLQNKTNETI
jgi:hypothetical protein